MLNAPFILAIFPAFCECSTIKWVLYSIGDSCGSGDGGSTRGHCPPVPVKTSHKKMAVISCPFYFMFLGPHSDHAGSDAGRIYRTSIAWAQKPVKNRKYKRGLKDSSMTILRYYSTTALHYGISVTWSNHQYTLNFQKAFDTMMSYFMIYLNYCGIFSFKCSMIPICCRFDVCQICRFVGRNWKFM